MKKVWIGGVGACHVHNEKEMIKYYLGSNQIELTFNHREADIIIVVDTCLGSYKNLMYSIDCIKKLVEEKKEDAVIIASGCLARGVKFELSDEQISILSKVRIVNQEDLVMYIAKLIVNQVEEADFEVLPHSIYPHHVKTSIVEGCLNNCSFCKSQYMNFGLKSRPFNQIEDFADAIEINDSPLYAMTVQSSNLSLYGIDLYGHSRAHEAINVLLRPKQVKFAYIGALINFYPELINEILRNPKIKHVMISIESGSPRVYELMNRPIQLSKLKEIIKQIKSERPDIVVHTEFIAGFPTETEDDLRRSVDLAYELDVYPEFVWPYTNSPQIASAKLPQHSFTNCCDRQKQLEEMLKSLREKYKSFIENDEHIMIIDDKQLGGFLVETTMGFMRFIEYDQLDREYHQGEIIPSGAIKPKTMTIKPINSSK